MAENEHEAGGPPVGHPDETLLIMLGAVQRMGKSISRFAHEACEAVYARHEHANGDARVLVAPKFSGKPPAAAATAPAAPAAAAAEPKPKKKKSKVDPSDQPCSGNWFTNELCPHDNPEMHEKRSSNPKTRKLVFVCKQCHKAIEACKAAQKKAEGGSASDGAPRQRKKAKTATSAEPKVDGGGAQPMQEGDEDEGEYVRPADIEEPDDNYE